MTVIPVKNEIGGPNSNRGCGFLFACASHQTRLDTRSMARRPIKLGIRGGEGRAVVEARTLLVYVAHRLTDVSLMSQACQKESILQFTHPEVAQPKQEPYGFKSAIAPFPSLTLNLSPERTPKCSETSGCLHLPSRLRPRERHRQVYKRFDPTNHVC